jgi:hypothetical protein
MQTITFIESRRQPTHTLWVAVGAYCLISDMGNNKPTNHGGFKP